MLDRLPHTAQLCAMEHPDDHPAGLAPFILAVLLLVVIVVGSAWINAGAP